MWNIVTSASVVAVFLSTNNVVTLVAAIIGAIAAIRAARVAQHNRREVGNLKEEVRGRRVVITRGDTSVTITDEDLEDHGS